MARKNGSRNTEIWVDVGLPKEFFPKETPKRNRQKELRILWVGRLFPRKGLPLVLAALGKIKNKVPFHFTIIGDGPMKKHLPDWIRENNLEKEVRYQRYVSWEKLEEAYSSHDLFMFCSLRESCGAQYLEAMAFGLPIVTLNLHGGRTLIPNNAGIKVEVSSSKQVLNDLGYAVEFLY